MKQNVEYEVFRKRSRTGRKNAIQHPDRQPHDHDTGEFRSRKRYLDWPETWRCCAMTLPSVFYMCPVCGKEQGMEGMTDYYLFDAE